MSAYWFLENVWAYSVQFAALAGFALLLVRLSRGVPPRARLALLQIGLLLGMCAPLFMVQSGPVLIGSPIGAVTIEATGAVAEAPRTLRPIMWALIALSAGAVLRLAWTLIGLVALAYRRRQARVVTTRVSDFLDLRSKLGVDAELLAGRHGPVAFGAIRPAVLVPESLLSGGPETLRAVLAHELIHLRRRDWLFVLSEELICALLWFHPLAWLLIREIRLTREEVVDAQAATAVSGAQPYLDALLAVARARLEPAYSLGAEFLRERQIARRIATLIRQENPMSRRLQYLLTSAGALVLAGVAWWSASFSPLIGAPQAAAPLGVSGKSVSVSQGADGLILPQRHGIYPTYSMGALISGIDGQVTMELTLDDAGNVVDARAVSGPLELRQGAVRWALDWRYDTSVQSARTVVATVTFQMPERGAELSIPLLGLPMLMEQADLPASSLVLRAVQTADLDPPNPALQAKLESYIGQNFGIDGALADAIQQEIAGATEATDSYQAPTAYVAPRVDGAVLLVRRPAPRDPKPAPRVNPGVPKRISVGGATQKKRVIRNVLPVYPALAKQAKVQGTVNLNVILSEGGSVRTVEVLSGHPLLIPAAIDAVKQWRYKPTLLNGQPVAVETTVDIHFTLSE